MISVAMLGGGADAAAYYLERAADCALAEYYTGEREQPGRWCGHGATALGLDGPVTGRAAEVFAGLLDGRLPDGTVVARPVWRADARGQLAAEPLVRELRHLAAVTAGVEVSELFENPQQGETAQRLVDRIDALPLSRRGAVRVDAVRVGELAVAAGLNPHVLYPSAKGKPGYVDALAHAGAKVDARRSGLDVVVSAPKSVSVLYGVADPTVARSVEAAHDRAVGEALGYLERHASHGMRGHQGDGHRAQRIGTDGFVAAAFTHHSSRADDPQLHTHLVVANLVHGSDGKWTAVDSRAVHRQARTAGCIYQAVLRGELTKTLGVDWGPIRKGVAEIVGIPAELRRAFSQRREQIEDELDRTGGSGRRAAQRATYRTRPAKSHTPETPLRQRWADRTRDLEYDPAAVVQAALDRTVTPELPTAESVATQMFGPDGLTRKTTSFDRRDVIQALTETLPAGLPVTGRQLEAGADKLLQNPNAIRLLQPAVDRDSGPRWSTADLLATEQTALELATRTTPTPVHALHTAVALAETAGLSAEQTQAVAALLTSSRLVDVVNGPAGSGKTALLRTAADGWRTLDLTIVGCSLAAVTARRLEAATGIPTTSLVRLLHDIDREPGRLPAGSVVVVDEASMVGTRDLATLAHHVAGVGGKLVLVGDPNQLPEIDAGGLFATLTRQPDTLTLTGNQRQQHSWERDALAALHAGDITTALDAYIAHDRIRIGADAIDARRDLVNNYNLRRFNGAGPYDLVALASTRRDAATLNREIRFSLRTIRLLGDDTIRVGSNADDMRRYAVGELVVVTRNDHNAGLLNGTRATITDIRHRTLTLTTETGVNVAVPAAWATEHLDYGYALTVHKAQGLTTGTALVYGTDALNQQAGYVAMSRGRIENHLFTSAASLNPDPHDLDIPRFKVLDREAAEPYDALTQRLSRRRDQILASHQRPHEDHQRWRDLHHPPPGRDGHGLSL